MQESKRKFVPIGKIWELPAVRVRSDFSSYVQELKESSQTNGFLGYWKGLKGALLVDKSHS